MSQNKKIDKSAKVLFSVFEENKAHQWGIDILELLSNLTSKFPKFKQFMLTKRINLDLKKEILSNIFSDILNESQLNLVFCLLENVDFKYLEAINKKYQKLIAESTGKVNIKAVTVSQLTESDLLDLETQIRTKINTEFTLDNVVDKSIIGGIKLRVGNTLIDGSLSTKLEKLKISMINK